MSTAEIIALLLQVIREISPEILAASEAWRKANVTVADIEKAIAETKSLHGEIDNILGDSAMGDRGGYVDPGLKMLLQQVLRVGRVGSEEEIRAAFISTLSALEGMQSFVELRESLMAYLGTWPVSPMPPKPPLSDVLALMEAALQRISLS